MSDYSFLSTSRFIKSAADELPSQSDKPIISRFYVFLSKKWKSTLFQLNLTISHGKVKKLRRLIQPAEHFYYSAFFLVSANAPIETTNAAIATAIPLPSPVLGESEGFAFVVVAVVVVVQPLGGRTGVGEGYYHTLCRIGDLYHARVGRIS
ncbi:MAG: hypothetical protein IKV85_01080, partial [Ruminococcus sp.]|nr:hypothetical protein [Ruminococcus sp.]